MSNPISRVTSRWSSGMAANLEATPDGHYVLSVGKLGRGRWHSIILDFDGLSDLMEPIRAAIEGKPEPKPEVHYFVHRSPQLPSSDGNDWLRARPWIIDAEEDNMAYRVSSHDTHIEAILEVEAILKARRNA